MRMILSLVLAMVIPVCACDNVCSTGETKCHGTVADVCDADGQWQRVMDCASVIGVDGESWACCAEYLGDSEVVHTCLPIDECKEMPR